MKKLALLFVFVLMAASLSAQTKSINLELFGSSGLAGINYDARFKGNSGFGFSAGLGYGYANSGVDFFDTKGNDGVTHNIGVPVEINYMFGKKNSHLVLGAGAYAGIAVNEAAKDPQFGGTLFADISYRYQKPTGLTFAIGLKPNLSNVLWPYIGIGYSF